MNQIPISKTNGIANYEQDTDIDIAPLTAKLVDFTHWNLWSPFYTKMEQIGDGSTQQPGNGQKLNVQRLYKTIMNKPGDDNIEELYEVNGTPKEGKVELKYRSVRNANPHIVKVETTITLTKIEDGKTHFKWHSESAIKLSFEEEVHEYSQIVARVLYGFLGSKIEKNPNDPLKPVVHPLDELVKAQTMMYHINILALGLHLIILAFKDKGFALINQKFVAIGGQAILGNLPSNAGKYQYGEYEFPIKLNMPKKVAGIPVSEVLPPKKFGRLLERLLEMAYLQVASLIDTAEHGDNIAKIDYVKSVELLSKTYGSKQDQMLTRHLVKKVDDDDELCQQLLQGVNPLMVEWVRDFKKVPLPMQGLTITDNKQEVTVKALFDQKRLFIVDYGVLDDLPVKNPNPGMYFYAPYLLLFREDLPNGQNRLSIVGIQLERGNSATVYQRKDTPDNLWSVVKMFVTCADNNAHEFGYHLGLSHLAIEPVCVAVHNQLPKTHALRSLLQPHLDETIGINFLARNTLVDSVLPFTNKTFVIGTQNGVAVASRMWDKFHFFDSSFPGQLASRGFDRNGKDGLTSYFYRDDGFRLWDCIGNYTTNVVNQYYKSDEDVQADKCIQKWAEEMADPARANMKGFPGTIGTKALLSQCLQIIIWHGSASHSVINYSQWPYIGIIKNRPNGLYKDIPKGKNEISDEDLDGYLAGPLPRLFQILFPWLLSAPISEDNLPALRAMSGEINNAFQGDLKDLTDYITERNKKLENEGKTPYVFCMPENIACSVSI